MNAHKEAERPTLAELEAAAELQRRKNHARTLAMLDVMRGAGAFWDWFDGEDTIMQAVRAAMAAQTYTPAARFDMIYAAVLHEANRYAEACAKDTQ